MIKRIVNRHPLFYGVIYLLLIPSYALIYNNEPRSFYHATAKYEPDLFVEKNKIMNSFEADFKKYRSEFGNRDTINQDSSVLLLNNFNVDGFWVENDYAYFILNMCTYDKVAKDTICNLLKVKFYVLYGRKITYPQYTPEPFVFKIGTFLDRKNKHTLKLGRFNLESVNNVMSIVNHKPTRLNLNDKNYYKELSVNEDSNFDINDFMADMPSSSKDSTGWSSYIANIVISENLDNDIIHYYRAINGFPYGYPKSNFIRMIYLSAITITTVGFGDIVPITDKARMLVTSEAVLGLIIIGLFLNSLASKIRDRKII